MENNPYTVLRGLIENVKSQTYKPITMPEIPFDIVLKKRVISFLESSKRSHRYCDDCYYTCPKHPEGCCDDSLPDKCNCGADEYNDKVDLLLSELKTKL